MNEQTADTRPIIADTTIATHVALNAYGPRYGVDWVYHDDRLGYLPALPVKTREELDAALEAARVAPVGDAVACTCAPNAGCTKRCDRDQPKPHLWVWKQGGRLVSWDAPNADAAWQWTPLFASPVVASGIGAMPMKASPAMLAAARAANREERDAWLSTEPGRGEHFLHMGFERAWEVMAEVARRDALADTAPTAAPCSTCNGRGEIGGFAGMDSGYQTDPCPDCTAPTAAAIVVWEKNGNCLWHVNCTAGPVPGRGIWRKEREEKERTLLKCVACGVYVYATHGMVDGVRYSSPVIDPACIDTPHDEEGKCPTCAPEKYAAPTAAGEDAVADLRRFTAIRDAVVIQPCIVQDWPNAHAVRIHVRNQQFAVGDAHESYEDAQWFAVQLRLALTRLAEYAGPADDRCPMCNKKAVFATDGHCLVCGWEPQYAIAAGEDAELWAMHLKGSDDLHAAPSRAAAELMSAWMNDRFAGEEIKPYAVAVPWPYTPESHAESVGEWAANWQTTLAGKPFTPTERTPQRGGDYSIMGAIVECRYAEGHRKMTDFWRPQFVKIRHLLEESLSASAARSGEKT